jgi:hypothetical protein
VNSIAKATRDDRSEEKLGDLVDALWERLEEKVSASALQIDEVLATPGKPERPVPEVLDELLTLTRQLVQRSPGRAVIDGGSAAGLAAPMLANLDPVAASVQGGMTFSGVVRTDDPKRVAEETVSTVLRQFGLDVAAMGVMDVDYDRILVFVPHAISEAVLVRVRNALKLTLPTNPVVDFYTSGESEVRLIDGDPSRTSLDDVFAPDRTDS